METGSSANSAPSPPHSLTKKRQGRERIVGLISSLKSARSLEDVKRIHLTAVERRLDSVLHVASSLVNMYSRFSCMHEAREIFDSMDSPDVILWNLLIRGYVNCGRGGEALEAFQQMNAQGCVPDAQTFVSVLKACSSVENKMECLEKLMLIHSLAERLNSVDSYVASTLIDLYSKCGSVRDAERVFDSMKSQNPVSWTALIAGYASNGDFGRGFELFVRMLSEGWEMDPHAFVAGIQALIGLVSEMRRKKASKEEKEAGFLEKAMVVHREAKLRGCTGDFFVGSSLVDLYSKCGSMQDARRVFDLLELSSDVVSNTALIFGYSHNGENHRALETFCGITCAPNPQTFVAVLHACSNLATEEQGVEFQNRVVKMNSLEKAFSLHREVVRNNFESDLCLSSTLVDLYSKCGSMADATRVFQQMPRYDVVSWTALMLGFAQNGQGEQGLELFSGIRSKGWSPDDQTYVAALKACSGSLETGKRIHSDICRCGLDQSAAVSNSLVDFYSKCGNMTSAQQVFDWSPRINDEVILWNSLITGYSRQGNTRLVLELFDQMKEIGVKSDRITRLGVLNACCHSGLVEEGKRCYDDAGDSELELEHYHCMVDMLGRANRLEEALEMVIRMPHEPNAFTWTIVLSSCQKWKNFRIGKTAYDHLVALDENLASTYVLMATL